ncbi:MAG TPA: hypothetical protein VF449_01375, partial [Parvibaculum sp.]
AAWLRYHPASGTVFALLTNGGNGKGLAGALLDEVFGAHAGVRPPATPEVTPGFAFDTALYEGRYANWMETIEVTAESGRLIATIVPSPSAAVISGVKRVPLDAVDAELFTGVAPGFTERATYHFLERDDAGRPRILHGGVRAHKRVGA